MVIPLQGLPTGGPFFAVGLIVLIIAVALGYWVYTDASNRGKDSAPFWGLGVGILTLFTLVGGLLGLVVYIVTR